MTAKTPAYAFDWNSFVVVVFFLAQTPSVATMETLKLFFLPYSTIDILNIVSALIKFLPLIILRTPKKNIPTRTVALTRCVSLI